MEMKKKPGLVTLLFLLILAIAVGVLLKVQDGDLMFDQEYGYNELLTIGAEIREYVNRNGENVILNYSVDEIRNKVILWVDGSVSLKQLSRLIDEKYFGAPYILQHPEKTTLC